MTQGASLRDKRDWSPHPNRRSITIKEHWRIITPTQTLLAHNRHTMSSIFCCNAITPYRPATLAHESKFMPFIAWARRSTSFPAPNSVSYFDDPAVLPAYAIQLVQQVNYGPIDSKRYFIPSPSSQDQSASAFVEVVEQDLIVGNFEKLNSYVWFASLDSTPSQIANRYWYKTDIRTLSVKHTTSFLRWMFTRRIPETSITGGSILQGQALILIFDSMHRGWGRSVISSCRCNVKPRTNLPSSTEINYSLRSIAFTS